MKNNKILTGGWLKVIGCAAVLFLGSVAGCDKYDDTALKQQVEDLTRRVVSLESLCRDMNSNISSLQKILYAIRNTDQVVGISKVIKDGVEIGYTITFAQSGAISIFNGKDGADGNDGINGKDGADGKDGKDGNTPAVGVKQGSDGEWYWTIDGEWMLTPDGEKVKASATAPQMTIRDGYWYISADGGKSWTKLEKATGDSFFKSVEDTGEEVVLVLSDGTRICIPKLKKIAISFDESEDICIMPGGQHTVGYRLSNVSGETLVKAIAQNGWRARVVPASNTTGKIVVSAPSELSDDEIIVLAYDGDYSLVMASISFQKGTIDVSDDCFEIPGSGGSVSTVVSSNVGMIVDVPSSASGWISFEVEPATKAMVYSLVTFTVKKNTSDGERSAVVTISDEGGAFSKTVSFYQKECEYVDVSAGGETANCYIINKAGDYKLPIVKGNGPTGVILSGDSAEINDASSASIVWQDGNIIRSVGIKNNFLTFSTYDSIPYGNAVIAVKNSSGRILWSWHIWSTDYVLGEGDVVVKNFNGTNAYCMMPLNLGSKSKSTYSSSWENDDSALFYQFGRKDPFPAKDVDKLAENGNINLSIANPDTYYSWNDWTDWCSESRMDWWDSGFSSYNYDTSSASDAGVLKGNKTIYDPCPPGYRVAPDDAFTGFTKTGTSVSKISDVNGSFNYNSFSYLFNADAGKQISFKMCGGLNASAGSYLTGIGYYQSAHAAGGGIQRQMILKINGNVNPMCAVYSRALAGAVRPIRNNFSTTDEPELDPLLDGSTVSLQGHTVGNGIKVLIAGDGYTAKDFVSGLYDSDMQKACNYLFSVEPFKSYRNRFDVIDYRAVSASSNFVGNQSTAFSVQFGSGTHITGDLSTAYNCAYSAFGTVNNVLIVIVINDHRYAGTCYMSGSGTSVAFVPASTSYYTFEDVIHHEACGHGFGFLGDEYSYSGTIPPGDCDEIQSSYSRYGWYANVDITDDPETIRWARFLSDEVYTNTVGIYEGAFTYSIGAYRPTYDSIMNANKGTFNSPSRYAIFNRIMNLSGDSTSWDKFVSYDKINLNDSSYGYNPKGAIRPSDFEPLAPPVVVSPEYIQSCLKPL